MATPENNHPSKNWKKDAFSDFIHSMDRLFGDKPIKGLLQSMDDFFATASMEKTFPVELTEKESAYVVIAKLPGISREQIELEFYSQTLFISISHHELEMVENESKGIFKKHSSTRRLSHSVGFAKPVMGEHIKANHRNGLLEIIVPKLKGKRIQIIE
ncbi:Hsp20/alpha crystallin family protein [Peribacillus saganii]|uniref:Hsp20/alpha crystallin family protein n=1 Tax=Peribacillus saganii TaxID=2303992 RepID=A0A372LMB9_9BACI|nr:Hsp20/alpha crystallin family protein [Peribacillus saganii]RFU68455.1 Hsp20/alpha crystallin family protein [Peribacillus saganii]